MSGFLSFVWDENNDLKTMSCTLAFIIFFILDFYFYFYCIAETQLTV